MPNESKWDKYKVVNGSKWGKYKASSDATAVAEQAQRLPSGFFDEKSQQPQMNVAQQSTTAVQNPMTAYKHPDYMRGAKEPFRDVSRTLNTAAQDFRKGNTMAGIYGGGSAGLKAGLALTGLPSVLGLMKDYPALENVAGGVELPMQGMDWLYQISAGGIIDKAQGAMGVPQDTRNKGNEFFRTAIPLAVLVTKVGGRNVGELAGESVMRGVKNIAQSSAKFANRAEQGSGTALQYNDVYENRKLADFNLNQAKDLETGKPRPYGKSAEEALRIEKDNSLLTDRYYEALGKARAMEKTIDFNPIEKDMLGKLNNQDFIGQRQKFSPIKNEITKIFDDVRKEYPDMQLPPDVAHMVERSLAEIAKPSAFEKPALATMKQKTMKQGIGMIVDAIDQVVPESKSMGRYLRNNINLQKAMERNLKTQESSAFNVGVPTKGNMRIPFLGNPSAMHGIAKIANKIGGGYMNPELLGSVPASADLSRVSMPRGQGGYYEEPPIYNGEQKFGNKSYPMYTDPLTKSTFIKMPNESIEQALARIRGGFPK